MPGPLPALDRRRVLAGGGLLALLALAVPACGSSSAPPVLDELIAQRDLARQDSALATAAGAALSKADAATFGAALTQVAKERTEHARALTDELLRAGRPDPTASAPATPSTSAAATPPPTVDDVVDALRTAADGAAKLAATSSGYRAGLLASIAAACTAAHTVALAVRP